MTSSSVTNTTTPPSRHDDMDDGLTAVRTVWITTRGGHDRHDFDILLTYPYKVLSQILAPHNQR